MNPHIIPFTKDTTWRPQWPWQVRVDRHLLKSAVAPLFIYLIDVAMRHQPVLVALQYGLRVTSFANCTLLSILVVDME